MLAAVRKPVFAGQLGRRRINYVPINPFLEACAFNIKLRVGVCYVKKFPQCLESK